MKFPKKSLIYFIKDNDQITISTCNSGLFAIMDFQLQKEKSSITREDCTTSFNFYTSKNVYCPTPLNSLGLWTICYAHFTVSLHSAKKPSKHPWLFFQGPYNLIFFIDFFFCAFSQFHLFHPNVLVVFQGADNWIFFKDYFSVISFSNKLLSYNPGKKKLGHFVWPYRISQR